MSTAKLTLSLPGGRVNGKRLPPDEIARIDVYDNCYVAPEETEEEAAEGDAPFAEDAPKDEKPKKAKKGKKAKKDTDEATAGNGEDTRLIGTVGGGETEFTTGELTPGEHRIQFVVVDSEERTSDPSTVLEINIEDPEDPDQRVNRRADPVRDVRLTGIDPARPDKLVVTGMTLT